MVMVDDQEFLFISCLEIEISCVLSDLLFYVSLVEFLVDGNIVSDNCGIDVVSFMFIEEIIDGNICL